MTTAPVTLCYHKHQSGHYYTLARIVEMEGELFAIPVKGQPLRQFRNRREAIKAAREIGEVHSVIVTDDSARHFASPVKPLAR